MRLDYSLLEKWVKNDFVLPLFNLHKKEIGKVMMRIEIAEPNNCVLKVKNADQELEGFFGYNCHQALDEYRKQLDNQGLIIGCVGAYRDFYVKRIMVRESLGLKGILTVNGVSAYAKGLKIVETFDKAKNIDNISTLAVHRNYIFDNVTL